MDYDYDFILLDSPPGKALLTMSALAAAHEVLIPMQGQRAALDGVQDLLSFIQGVVWDRYNPQLKICGILPTMFKRTTTHAFGITAKAREIWGAKVFPVEIPDSIAFSRAYAHGLPLIHFDPLHYGAQGYLKVATLILNPPDDETGQPKKIPEAT
jgi:chromosome partitioning protein